MIQYAIAKYHKPRNTCAISILFARHIFTKEKLKFSYQFLVVLCFRPFAVAEMRRIYSLFERNLFNRHWHQKDNPTAWQQHDKPSTSFILFKNHDIHCR